MANLSETLTRDRPPQKVVIGNRVTRAELDPMLAAHARFLAGRIDGRRAVLLRCDLRGLDLRGIDLSGADLVGCDRSEEHTSELQSLMRISYAVFCLKKKKK